LAPFSTTKPPLADIWPQRPHSPHHDTAPTCATIPASGGTIGNGARPARTRPMPASGSRDMVGAVWAASCGDPLLPLTRLLSCLTRPCPRHECHFGLWLAVPSGVPLRCVEASQPSRVQGPSPGQAFRSGPANPSNRVASSCPACAHSERPARAPMSRVGRVPLPCMSWTSGG
jgi:hypothetical protein